MELLQSLLPSVFVANRIYPFAVKTIQDRAHLIEAVDEFFGKSSRTNIKSFTGAISPFH
jgi:hypothetical protein